MVGNNILTYSKGDRRIDKEFYIKSLVFIIIILLVCSSVSAYNTEKKKKREVGYIIYSPNVFISSLSNGNIFG